MPEGALPWKLWIYTNYDCNIQCSYCVARSSPHALRRAIGLTTVKQLVAEAVDLGFAQLYFTGGEPFLLPDIYEMLAEASAQLPTTVLTNAMLLRGARLEKLAALQNDNLIVQVSLDGGRAADHEAYRGEGSWAKTVDGIKLLQAQGFRVRLGTTETPANAAHLDQLCAFHRSLGIPDEDHFIRPLAKRGFATEGIELTRNTLVPELTVNVDGVFWHPLSTEVDMQVSQQIFPLAEAVAQVQALLGEQAQAGGTELQTFT